MIPSIIQSFSLSTKDLITSVLNNYFIIDYGVISAINADDTFNVRHATLPQTNTGETLGETITENVEMLTLSGSGFAIRWDYKEGDKVLLVGLKNYVPKAGEIDEAKEADAILHYSRETIKAIPLCTFNEEAKATVEIKEGVINLNGDDNGGLCITPELVRQLGYLSQRVDTIIDALKNSPTASEDGGAAYKAGITSVLAQITNKEDFSGIESEKVMHGKGGE